MSFSSWLRRTTPSTCLRPHKSRAPSMTLDVTICKPNVFIRIFSTTIPCCARQKRGFRPTWNKLTISILKKQQSLQNHAAQSTQIQRGIVKLLEKQTGNFDGLKDVVKQQTEISGLLLAHSKGSGGWRSRFPFFGGRPFSWRQLIGNLALIIILVPFGAEYLENLLTSWGLRHWSSKPANDASAAHVEGLKLIVLDPGTASDPIVCSLHLAKDLGQPSYECLSYRCGDQSIRREIICSGAVDTVGANLYSALKDLRHPKEKRVLWVDELCINQSNLVERREQVGRMGDIYSNASRVLIWLGEPGENMHYAFDTIKLLDTFFRRDKLYWIWLQWIKGGKALEHLDNDPFLQSRDWDSLRDLLSNQYFERTWIVQEIARSRDAVIVSGRDTLRWNTFIHVIQRMVETEMQSLVSSPVVDKHFGTLYSIWVLRIRARVNGEAGPLLDLYKTTSKFTCGDERDRLFGVLSMATDIRESNRLVRPDYALDLKEALMRFGLWVIVEKKDLYSLSWSRRQKDSKSQESAELPSWIPDNRNLTPARSMLLVDNQFFTRPFAAAGDKDSVISIDPTDPNALHIMGRRIGHITKTGATLNERLRPIASTSPEDTMVTKLLDEVVPKTHLDIARAHAWITEAYDLAQYYSNVTRPLSATPSPSPSSTSTPNIDGDTDTQTNSTTPSLSTLLGLSRTLTSGLSYQSHRLSWIDHISTGLLVRELRLEKELGFFREQSDPKQGEEGSGRETYKVNPSPKLVRHFTTFGAGIRRGSRAVGMWSVGRRLGICTLNDGSTTNSGINVGDSEAVAGGAGEETTGRSEVSGRTKARRDKNKLKFACLPETAREGDLIVVLYGGKVPYVLRPFSPSPSSSFSSSSALLPSALKAGTGKGGGGGEEKTVETVKEHANAPLSKDKVHYKILGECYVDGMMDGELLKGKNGNTSRDETFILR